jgi:hypothetical protein
MSLGPLRVAAIAAFLTLSAPAVAQPAAIPVLPVSIAVAAEAGKPAPDEAWIDAQLAEAERLIGGAGVHLRKAAVRALPERFARLETRKDRDALAAELRPSVINVFVVASLRDVDDPRRYRMGVHWQPQITPRRHYVIVATSALPSTLAHELGHFFGLPHTAVKNNLMSYDRDGSPPFLDAKQTSTIEAFARLYLRAKEIAP